MIKMALPFWLKTEANLPALPALFGAMASAGIQGGDSLSTGVDSTAGDATRDPEMAPGCSEKSLLKVGIRDSTSCPGSCRAEPRQDALAEAMVRSLLGCFAPVGGGTPNYNALPVGMMP